MTFTWPIVLVGLFLVPIVVLLYIGYDGWRRDSAADFGNPDLLPNVVDREPGRLRHLPLAILLVALATMIVGVARPHANVKVKREEATVILAMDTSRSMGATDVSPTRLDAARAAARAFVAQGPGEVSDRRRLVRDACSRRASPDGRPHARRRLARHAPARRGDGDRRRRRALRPARAEDSRGGREQPAQGGRAHLRRRAGGRACVSRGRRRTCACAARPRLLRARGHAGRRRPPEADRRLRPDHPASPRARGRSSRSRRPPAASSSRRRAPTACARCTRISARASARAPSPVRSPTGSPPAPPCSCSSGARSRRSSSGGFREARRRRPS